MKRIPVSCSSLRAHHRRERGFTLLEVMIALVVLAIGVVGLIALQMSTYKQLQTSHNFTKAALLAGDMADRMLANRAQVLASDDYEHDSLPAEPVPNCAAAACSAGQLAAYDVWAWQTALSSLDSDGVRIPGALPEASGEVVQVGADYIIRVRWDDDLSGSTDDTDCANDDPDKLDCFELNLGPLI